MEGTKVALNCVVTGMPMPSVSWLEVKTGNHSSQNPFLFANVSRNKAGEYICRASNPCGHDSKSGILTVICKYIYSLEYAKLEETLKKIKNDFILYVAQLHFMNSMQT